jgi:hypothetical protein
MPRIFCTIFLIAVIFICSTSSLSSGYRNVTYTGYTFKSFVIYGNFVFGISFENLLTAITINNYYATLVNTAATSGASIKLFISNNYAYSIDVLNGESNNTVLTVLDISNPVSSIQIFTTINVFYLVDVYVTSNYVYLLGNYLQIYSLQEYTLLYQIPLTFTGEKIFAFDNDPNYLYVYIIISNNTQLYLYQFDDSLKLLAISPYDDVGIRDLAFPSTSNIYAMDSNNIINLNTQSLGVISQNTRLSLLYNGANNLVPNFNNSNLYINFMPPNFNFTTYSLSTKQVSFACLPEVQTDLFAFANTTLIYALTPNGSFIVIDISQSFCPVVVASAAPPPNYTLIIVAIVCAIVGALLLCLAIYCTANAIKNIRQTPKKPYLDTGATNSGKVLIV